MKLPRKPGKRKVPAAAVGALGGLVAGAVAATAVTSGKAKDVALKVAATVGSWAERGAS